MGTPDVSVVIPVYNGMPYLTTCLSSLLEQSIGRDQLEVIAVDDGSTDGSGDQLDLLARSWPQLRVFHQSNSGGPSRPSNAGIDRATGRYLMLVDQDDYLGAEALERMVAVADERGSDIVTGRHRGVGGRELRNRAAAQLRQRGIAVAAQDSMVHATPHFEQLFRRSFVSRLGLRFPEGLEPVADFVFISSAYLHSPTVSAVDDYDCYYQRLRDDGRNLTTRLAGTERYLEALDRGLEILAGQAGAGRTWDQVVRGAVLDLTHEVFGWRFVDQEAPIRERLVARARAMLERWLTAGVLARLRVLDRLKVRLLCEGDEPSLRELVSTAVAGERPKDVVIGGRVYAAYPPFRDPSVGIPDECFDITGELTARHHLARVAWTGNRLRLAGYAYIEHVDTVEVHTEVGLRDRLGKVEHRWRVRPGPTPELAAGGQYDYGWAGFEVELDLAAVAGGEPLAPGRWSAFLDVRTRGVRKQVSACGGRAEMVDELAGRVVRLVTGRRARTASASFTKYGNLVIEVAEAPADRSADDLPWDDGDRRGRAPDRAVAARCEREAL